MYYSPSLSYVIPRGRSFFHGCGNTCSFCAFIRLECDQLAKRVFRRQSRTLIASPSLTVTRIPTQARARTLSVHISRSNVSDLVKLLLPLLSNLDTLEVLTEDRKLSGAEDILKSAKLPQIRTLVIDTQAHHLMKCCTRVRRLVGFRHQLS